MKTGMQLYCVNKEMSNGKFEYALEQAAKTGVDGLECYNLYDKPAIQYRKAFNNAGIVCCGTHNLLKPLVEDLDHVMEYNYALGNKNIVCCFLSEEERGTLDGLRHVADSFNEIGYIMKKNGFQFLYHNHDFEFREHYMGKCVMDILMENTEPDLVKMQLHIGQLPKFNIDIVEYIHRYSRRIGVLHCHAFMNEVSVPFDSAPAVRLAKDYDVEWAVLENVYPEPIDYDLVQKHVSALRQIVVR